MQFSGAEKSLFNILSILAFVNSFCYYGVAWFRFESDHQLSDDSFFGSFS
jgi:hypothetical protein